MINFFVNNSRKKREQLDKEVYQYLNKFYNSFFSNIYNELNINKYKQIRDAIGLVMRKFDSHDHPLAYTSKLVMYIQARITLHHLHLTNQQQKLMQKLSEKTKYVNLNYVYTSPLDDARQFTNI